MPSLLPHDLCHGRSSLPAQHGRPPLPAGRLRVEAPGEHSHTDARGRSSQGCPLDEHLPKVRAPGVQSPPGVRPHGAGPSRVQLLPPGTQSSLCPLGLKVKVNVTPRGGGEAWSQRDCPLQGLSSLLSACFLSWWENGGSDMVTSPAPITARPESPGRHSTGHQGCGQPSPEWRATTGDQEPWWFVPAAQGRVTPTATCPAPPPGALAIA